MTPNPAAGPAMTLNIRPLRSATSLRDSVEASLAAAIVSGEIDEGTLLSVPTLAARFEVSATPVREAMLDLEKRGFVEPVRNKGFRVTAVSQRDLEEIVGVRRLLEAPPMVDVAATLAGASLERYRALADRIVEAVERSDLAAYLAADSAFHLTLLRLTGNERLVDLVAELRTQTRMIGLSDMLGTPELTASAQEHHELLDLLGAGKGRDARAFMERHVGHVLGWWAGKAEHGTGVR
jgi:DNA-binding GntR family transcriptional regulator